MKIKTVCFKCNFELEKNLFTPDWLPAFNVDNMGNVEWYCENCGNTFFVDKLDKDVISKTM